MFCCRELLFSKLFYRHQQQQPPLPVLRAAAGNRSFFSRISDDTLGSFFVWFWTLLVLQSHGVLLPGAAFFEAVLPASAAAAAATSSASSRRQQNLSTLLVLQSHGVLLPGAAFFEAVLSASAVRISDDTLCFAAGSCFFRSCFAGISSSSRRHHFCEQPQATESLDNLSTSAVFFSKISDDTLGSFLAWFWTLLVLQSHGVLLPGAAFFERHQSCEQP